MSLGCEPWSVYLAERGGSRLLLEIPVRRGAIGRAIDRTEQATIDLPNDFSGSALCCEVLATAEPFRHELVFFRGRDRVWEGPIFDVTITNDASILAKDLSSWMEVRFIEDDLSLSTDAARVFERIVEYALRNDSSPNITIDARSVGEDILQQFDGKNFTRVADALNTIARTAVDYTIVGRTMLVGNLVEFFGEQTILIHDEGIVRATVRKEGTSYMNDAGVTGDVPPGASDPVYGRATGSQTSHGLVQRSFAELNITDSADCSVNAQARLDAVEPFPDRISVLLGPDADMSFSDLIPGRRADARLSKVLGCAEGVFGMRLLQSMSASFTASDSGFSEEVSVELIPLGTRENALAG